MQHDWTLFKKKNTSQVFFFYSPSLLFSETHWDKTAVRDKKEGHDF